MAAPNCGPASPLRLGQVIELREECTSEYMRVHADGHAGVRDLLSKHGLTNFSIFMQVVHGKRLLFLYGEYVGSDYVADMAALAAEPRRRVAQAVRPHANQPPRGGRVAAHAVRVLQ